MSRGEFLDCSPRELAAFFDRLEARREETRFASGLITAAIYNVNRDPEKYPEPFEPFDFMPGHKRRELGRGVSEDFLEECIRNNFEHIPTEEDKRIAADFVAQLKAQVNPKMIIEARTP